MQAETEPAAEVAPGRGQLPILGLSTLQGGGCGSCGARSVTCGDSR